MKCFLIFPEIWQIASCPLSSSTRNIESGKASTISPRRFIISLLSEAIAIKNHLEREHLARYLSLQPYLQNVPIALCQPVPLSNHRQARRSIHRPTLPWVQCKEPFLLESCHQYQDRHNWGFEGPRAYLYRFHALQILLPRKSFYL